jgi:CheY-specific phosphatase CheX
MMTAPGGVGEIADTLGDLVRIAWTTVTGCNLNRVAATPLSSRIVCSSVALSGPGNALVMLFADQDLARRGTSTALGSSAADVDETAIHDVLGEVVNIIGGNLKGSLPDGVVSWQLSLPVVSEAMQHSPGSRSVADVCFTAGGAVLRCQILEHR